MELAAKALARGFRLLALDTVDSTNSEARRLIGAGERGPLWIVAQQQTAGRGRMGREWLSRPGNLYASLILSGIQARNAPQLGFVLGVALMRALHALVPQAPVALKWPNDALLGGGKLAGVLLEGVSYPTGDARAPLATAAIIGVGVNCASAPEDLPYPAAALSQLGPEAPDAKTLFAYLSGAIIDTLTIWQDGAGFAQLREEWLRHANGLGEEMTVALANETIQGRFETIDEAGQLVLATEAGRRVIDAGDVVIGPRSAVSGVAPKASA